MLKTAPHMAAVLAFLDSIGIRCRMQDGAEGFLKNVLVEAGTLVVDSGASIEDVLHEAGHLAIIPEIYRHLANGDLRDVGAIMGADNTRGHIEIDSPLSCAITQCDESEATAWSWAAGVHLGLPPKVIISDAEYGGNGASVRVRLQTASHFGINGLCRAGMCAYPRRGPTQYPQLLRWTQTAGNDSRDLLSPHFIQRAAVAA